jgi:serine/threonine protein kinase
LDDVAYQQLDDSSLKFIILSITNTLSYLSSKNLLHRNICPRAIWIDLKGIVWLSGFSYAKTEENRTYSVLDTNCIYKARETILGRGYSQASDYWSLGIILYQYAYRRLPFGILNTDSTVEIVQKILQNELAFPETIQEDTRMIIQGLLQYDYTKRFQFEEIFNSDWAKSFSVEDIEQKRQVPPYVPKHQRQNGMNSTKHMNKKGITKEKAFKSNSAAYEMDWDEYF